MKKRFLILLFSLLLSLLLPSCDSGMPELDATSQLPADQSTFVLSEIPEYSGDAYVVVNGNTPYFDTESLAATSVEIYSPLDSLGRCGVAYACIGRDLMPTEDRGSIGQIQPSGWHTVKYDCVDGKYLYNRCHLIGYQLTAENANEENLITGTRYLNIEGMLPFENMVADYVKETGNHVAYRVTPQFEGDNLVAAGVLMEGYSVEDQGAGICYCIFAYNVQPGVEIDYTTGASQLAASSSDEYPYVLNTNSRKFHAPGCSSVDDIQPENREDYSGSREYLIAQGYEPCKRCNP